MSHVSDGALHAYLDGESSERERAEIESHLAGCGACRERLEEATALSSGASELLSELEPSGISAPPWHKIEERSRARRRAPARRAWVRPGLAWAASIAIAFAIGWFSRSYWSELPGPDALATRSAPVPGRVEPVAAPAGETAAEPEPARQSGVGREQGDAEVSEADGALAEENKLQRALADEAARTRLPASEPTPAARAAPQQPTARDQAPTRAEERAKEEAQAEEAVPPPTVPESGEAVVPAPAAPESTEAVVERLEGENRVAALDRLRGELAPHERESARRIMPTGARSARGEDFLNVSMEKAPEWLGGRLRTLPELQLVGTEVGPGSTMEHGSEARPAIRLRYLDAAGNEITLIQQWIGEAGAGVEGPHLVIEPSGLRSYRWHDSGYRLVLEGKVSGDSLRALAERVR